MNRFAGALFAAALLVFAVSSMSSAQTDRDAPKVLATGKFVNKGGQMTSGTYRVEQVGEYRRLLLMDNFQTNDGPDLHVVLSPTTADSATNDNVMDGAAVIDSVAALQGKQVYYLADSLEVGDYRSVLIHCVEFSHLYGAAPIE